MMAKKAKEKGFLNMSFWRGMVNFWSVILYATIIADFYSHSVVEKFLGPIAGIYIASLALYSAEKEFERWHDYNIGRHPGEVYIIIWTLLIIVLLCLEALYPTYTIPAEVFSTYIVVIGVLAITRRSKSKYRSNKMFLR